jgi:nicotinamidase/pyrazinamidase
METKALIVVDPLNDFFNGGVLAVPEAERIIEPIKKMINAIESSNGDGWLIICARDWHPCVSEHFEKWPIHCVVFTEGAKIYHKLYDYLNNVIMIYKGVGRKENGYSAFDGFNEKGLSLKEILNFFEVEEIYVCGLATEYCDMVTAIDSAKNYKYKTFLIKDACRAVNDKDGEKAIKEMERAGVIISTSDEFIENL